MGMNNFETLLALFFNMNHDRIVSNNKILPITLARLDSVIQSSFKKNFSFQFLSFVARLTGVADGLLKFSDETGAFDYELKHTQRNLVLQPNQYYECIGVLRNFNLSFRLELLNIKSVDGNYIALHMIRVVKQQFEMKALEMELSMLAQQPPSNNDQDLEKTYQKMKEWCQKTQEFTLDQLQHTFVAAEGKQNFQTALEMMEDQELIGNMGDSYIWMSKLP